MLLLFYAEKDVGHSDDVIATMQVSLVTHVWLGRPGTQSAGNMSLFVRLKRNTPKPLAAMSIEI